MADPDIRWHQRLSNFGRALAQLERFVAHGEALNELEEQGLIHVFEYNFGVTRTYKPCIAYNNKIKRFEKYAKNYRSNTVVLNGGDL